MGAGVGALAVVVTLTFLYLRKRSSRLEVLRNSHAWGDNRTQKTLSINPGNRLFQLDTHEAAAELSANSRYEMPELATTESAVEVPARYGFFQEDGNFF